MIYKKWTEAQGKKRLFALLVDPENQSLEVLVKTAITAEKTGVDILLVGGSLMSRPIDQAIINLKKHTKIPVILFPGSLLQLSPYADGILLLSLISGRNPEYLIGNHVQAAPVLRKSGIEIIPTGYILVNCGSQTSVEYMSHTRPVPYHKTDIAVATAIAGEMLGLKMIYLEGGSGAEKPVNPEMISAVKKQISIPLIVGGGLKTTQDIINACKAGADIIVSGTAIEKNLKLLKEFVMAAHTT